MAQAQVFTREVGNSHKRVSKIADARSTLRGFGKKTEMDILTFGQFSIIDVIEAVLDRTGLADVALATWTAAGFDLSQIQKQLEESKIRSLRMIVDRSFVSRQPAFVDHIHKVFGQDVVRSTRTHAKFAVITNDRWQVVIRTSANLNHNARLEFIQVANDPKLAAFYLRIVEEIFAEEPPGLENRRNLPEMAGIDGVAQRSPVEMGSPPAMGKAPKMGK